MLLDYLGFFIPTKEHGVLHSDAHINGQFLRITSMRGLILSVFEIETNLNLTEIWKDLKYPTSAVEEFT